MTDTKRVAIVSITNIETSDYDYNSFDTVIAQSITEWETVTIEEYNLLKNYIDNRKYFLVTQEDTSSVVEMTVKKGLAEAKKQEERAKAYREQCAKKEAEKLARKQQREIKKIKKLIESNPEILKEVTQ